MAGWRPLLGGHAMDGRTIGLSDLWFWKSRLPFVLSAAAVAYNPFDSDLLCLKYITSPPVPLVVPCSFTDLLLLLLMLMLLLLCVHDPLLRVFPTGKGAPEWKGRKGEVEWNGMGLSAKWREEKETQYLIVYYCFVCCRIVTDWPMETVSWTVRRITIWLALRRTRRTRFSASVASSSPATTRISTFP